MLIRLASVQFSRQMCLDSTPNDESFRLPLEIGGWRLGISNLQSLGKGLGQADKSIPYLLKLEQVCYLEQNPDALDLKQHRVAAQQAKGGVTQTKKSQCGPEKLAAAPA